MKTKNDDGGENMTDKQQVGLRLPEEMNGHIALKAKEIGISKNALIQVLVDIGLKTYDGFTVSLPKE